MASTQIVREETCCHHRVLLYASSYRQDKTYHSLSYTSCGALAGTRNSSMVHPMKDRSDDPSHHEQTLLPRSYILLPWSDSSRFPLSWTPEAVPHFGPGFFSLCHRLSICLSSYTLHAWPYQLLMASNITVFHCLSGS